MSKIIVQRRALLLGSAAVALAPAAVFAATDVGKPAAAFSAPDSNGKTWSLADLKGKVVVLETSNQDCPYVRKHYNSANMQTQQREAAAKGVVWLTVAT
jgi:peroxiredoxin